MTHLGSGRSPRQVQDNPLHFWEKWSKNHLSKGGAKFTFFTHSHIENAHYLLIMFISNVA